MAALAALVFSVFSAPQVQAVAPGPIVGVDGKCLENKNGIVADGNPAALNICNGAAQQQWIWNSASQTLVIQDKCLDVTGKAVGSGVQISTCNGSNAQKWRPTANNSLVNLDANLCLGTALNLHANGVVAQLKTCNELARTQRWDISAAIRLSGTPDPHATLPDGPFVTPTPTITLDYSQTPEFADWMERTVKPILEAWYPVIGDYYAQPDHAPMSSFTVKIDPNYKGIAKVEGSRQRVVMGPDYYRTHLNDIGSLIHEIAHIATVNPDTGTINLPGWLTEGIAEHARDFLYVDRSPWIPTPSQTYLNGYRPAAALLEHAQQTSPDSTFLKTLAANAWNDTYDDDLFLSASGYTVSDHWHQLTGQVITDLGAVTNQASARCLDLPGGAQSNGTLPQIYTCNDTSAQKWIFKAPLDSLTGQVTGYLGSRCLTIVDNGTAAGTAVEYRDCLVSNNPGQVWEVMTAIDTGGFTTLRNPHSGKCLQPLASGTGDSTKLEIQPCTTAASQKWKFPPVYR